MWSVSVNRTFISVELVGDAGLASLPGHCHRRSRSAESTRNSDAYVDGATDLALVRRPSDQQLEAVDFGTGNCETKRRTLSDIGRSDTSSTTLSSIASELICRSSDEDDDEWPSINEVLRSSIRPRVPTPVVHGMRASIPARPNHCTAVECTERIQKKVDIVADFEARFEQEPIFTLMIRNVPNRCSQRALIKELESLGLGGTFDFVYVPLDLRTISNVGYAFVNFLKSTDACRCARLLQCHRMQRQVKIGKEVAVSVAQIQGLEANIRHYEKSTRGKSRLRQRRPVLLPNGQEE